MSAVPLIPENAPFDAAQRLWLNGFLAGLFSTVQPQPGAGSDAPAAAKVPLLIAYGSQTGTAEGLARKLGTQANGRGLQARVIDAATHAKVDWKAETNLLVITSTYGDGDPPDNIQGFWHWLQTAEAQVVAHLNFSVLALGDSHYEHFCAAGKKIDTRLEELGAKRIVARVDCDVAYEAAAKAWTEAVLSALRQTTASGAAHEPSTPVQASQLIEPEPVSTGYSKTNPYLARLLTNRRLSGDGSGKEVRHFEIALEGSALTYEAGDALGVSPTNCGLLVDDLLRHLGCDGEEAVRAPQGAEVSLRKALTDYYDITKPSPELLARAAEQNLRVRELLAPERKEDLRSWLYGREIIDLLLGTPGLALGPADLIELLKPLAPRLYSICSSPKATPGQVHLTVNIVRHDSHGRARKGICSTFLADRVSAHMTLPIFVQKSPGFRLPANGDAPMIMIGPGTGVAPFRAFLQERQAIGAKGRNWLFFGEQRAACDFYYREDLEGMLASGHLTKLCTAFSRDQEEKIYVQHRMLAEAAALWTWLQDGAHVYVCGDASRMAKDVDAALHRVIETAGELKPEAAAQYVQNLKAERRYQRDVY